ncbi:peptidase [Burkholderia sp. MSMB617WGS]|uniref:Peptidase n=2 Tax=Burkholderiaceae TaxID=119060 RepID=A0ABR5T578_9BURK|nr:peptidase [Burkholderia savannae]AOK50116.1 peptidase [Burkholderia sp. MSMB617WGS]KVG47685.1 peptidase [Burkholderia sp. MSMB0265]KVG80571.1 peptidase [Burkholderia sp. MSMB2040]KVG93992.1 peptidase [Burkholderia sp. MSMB2042]KVG96635.1 peptidase [Burkholderia sp. MSMB2041]KVK87999.1 peptidase [Burkholderia sp. MSMB1498]
MYNKRSNPDKTRFGQARAVAGILSMSFLVPLAGCGGGGGGGGSSTPSAAAQPTPAPAPTPAPSSGSSQSATSSTSTAACPVTQAASTAASAQLASSAVSQDAPVDHLIVKLQDAAATAGSGARIMAATNGATRLDAVIQRVMSQWNTKSGAARAYAQNVAPTSAVQVERTMSGGATLLALGQKMNADTASALAQTFAADPDVAYAEPDRRVFARTVANDPDYAQQWNYFDPTAGIDLPNAWNVTTGSPGIVTAVLDTGYRPHPDLIANLLPGYDFITDINTGNNGHGRGPDATDPGDWVTQQELTDPSSPFYQCASGPSNSSWHGTQVAGIIGAAANNGIGIAGVNWYGKILPVRVLGKCGGATSDIADAMRWAAGLPVAGAPTNLTPAKVINLSLGGTGTCGDTFQQAINDVIAKGVSVVVSAGNDGQATTLDRPANCQGVIAVGATDSTGQRAWYSNFGTDITLSAPGSNILSTTNAGTTVPTTDAYGTHSGTSLAAPQIAGIASLMLSANPNLTPAQIAQKLAGTARPSPSTTSCLARAPGAGIADAGVVVASATK